MKTHLLKAPSGELEKYRSNSAKQFRILTKGMRAVVTCKTLPRALGPFVAVTYDGDESQSAAALGWLDRTIVDDLHAEFVSKSPIRPSVQRAAVKRLRGAEEALEAAERQVERCRKALRSAQAHIVKTHGRRPLINGKEYSVSYHEDQVWLNPILSKAEIRAAQEAALARRREKIG